MTALGFSPDEVEHAALVDELATAIHSELADHNALLHSAVLATLLARFVVVYPPPLRPVLVTEHLQLAQGLVELLELQAENRQAN